MRTGRILVIDDDVRHRASVTQVLASAGHEVVGEGSGGDVERLLDDVERPDVMLLDLNMPDLHGFDVLAELRSRRENLNVIVITGETGEHHLRRLLRLGASDCLAKPYVPDDLLRSVDEAMQRRALDAASEDLLARVQESDRLHRFLVEQSPDVIYMLDARGRFTFLSASSEAVFGQRPEALVGKHWSVLFAPGEQERAAYRFDERRSGHRATRNLELRLAEGDIGSPRWVRVSAMGLYHRQVDDPDGPERFDGTYGIVRDVSETRAQEENRAALESQLEQARRMESIGQLAGGIAHDFNNILASMIGYAELAQMTAGDGTDSATAGYLGEVISAGQRARDLIAQLLNFSRPQEGVAQAVRLDEQIDSVSRMLRAVIPTSVRIEQQILDTPLAVMIDPVQLQQIVLNLFINARDAVSEDGTIRVHVRHEAALAEIRCAACPESISGERVVLEVSDDGVGIQPEVLRRLFDPVVTARPGTRGTGFGLTLVQSIVHRFGGHLEVESTPGAGTTFRIFFPAGVEVPSSGASQGLAEVKRSPRASGHVVVVDDEASVANFLRELLEHEGYQTTVFNDPETALDYLMDAASAVDLVITDQTMPRLTGIELSRRVARLDPAPPVILCTGYGHEMTGGDRDHLSAVLAKPFEIRALLARVAQHVQTPAADVPPETGTA